MLPRGVGSRNHPTGSKTSEEGEVTSKPWQPTRTSGGSQVPVSQEPFRKGCPLLSRGAPQASVPSAARDPQGQVPGTEDRTGQAILEWVALGGVGGGTGLPSLQERLYSGDSWPAGFQEPGQAPHQRSGAGFGAPGGLYQEAAPQEAAPSRITGFHRVRCNADPAAGAPCSPPPGECDFLVPAAGSQQAHRQHPRPAFLGALLLRPCAHNSGRRQMGG